jgi:MFS family permease
MYSKNSKRLVQLVAALGSALAPFMVSSIIVATPAIGAEFSADIALQNWVTAAFFIFAGALLVPFGRVADVRGSKRVFTGGMVVYLVAAAVSGLAPGILILITGRALTGVGAAMVFGTSLALLSLVFPEEERGRAIGMNIAAMFAGFAVGLLAGGAIATYTSWRYLFAIVALVSALNIVIILSWVKGECELARTTTYDPGGMMLLIPGVLLFMFGLATIGQVAGIGALLAGLACLGIFIFWERRCSNPLIPRTLMASRNLIRAAGANVIFNGSAFGITFILSLYLQYVTGFDASTAGLLLLISQGFLIVLSPFTGRLSDRYPPHQVAALGSAVNAIAMLLLTRLSPGSSLWLVVGALALNGIGFALFMPSVIKWALLGVRREEYGLLTGLTETARLAGISISNAIIIILFSLGMGNAAISTGAIPEFITAARISVTVYAAMALAAMIVALWGSWSVIHPAGA